MRKMIKIAVSSILLFGLAVQAPNMDREKAPESHKTSITGNISKTIDNSSKKAKKHQIKGIASHYGGNYTTKRKMANGDYYHPGKLTAAMTKVPLGTKVRVKNLQNGKVVEVEVTDRGPYVKGRVIDLSVKAAKALDIMDCGLTEVEVTVIS